MRRALTTIAFILLLTPAFASPKPGWKKAYFGATMPGCWTTYVEMSSNAPRAVTTYRRLSDDERQPRIERRTSYARDKVPPLWNHFTIRKGFDLSHDLIDFMEAVTEGSASAEEHNTHTFEEAELAEVLNTFVPYGPHVVYQGIETVAEKRCDHYTYSLRHDDEPVRVEKGEFWMSDSVPFGIVRHTATTTDLKGKVLWTFMRDLMKTGVRPAPPLPSPEFLAASSHALQEAYDAGILRISVATPTTGPQEKRSDHLRMTIESRIEQPFTLTIPAGTTTLFIGPPLDDFSFDVPAAKQFPLTADHPAELTVDQSAELRIVTGSFQTYVFEGTPLYVGTAMRGTVHK
jgi:hypothetical protein